MCSRFLVLSTFACILFPGPGLSDVPPSESAKAFGTKPTVWDVSLSPNGQKLSFLSQHPSDMPIAMVFNLATGERNLVLASDKGEMELTWCGWANDTRLLCGYYGIVRIRFDDYGATRLVAVNEDGSNKKVLVQNRLREEWAFYQDQIVDWLPDDPERILMAVRKGDGQGVSSVNIYSNEMKSVERARENVWHWISDGRGSMRVRRRVDERFDEWHYRESTDSGWQRLHRSRPEDLTDKYWPVGFGEDLNELLVVDDHEGRAALFSEDLSKERQRELLFAHPEFDLDGIYVEVGKYRRLTGVTYSTDKPHVHYFDDRVRKIVERAGKSLPGQIVSVIGESWDQRYYLIHSESDVEPGAYYRFDTRTNGLLRIIDSYPLLRDVRLSSMTPMTYAAEDGTPIPAYLTLPASRPEGPVPTVILPHGGPQSRDEWGFDWLAQFLAHRGYAVLQSNFRGSGGYGSEWAGEGGFREWRRAISDLEFSARAVVEKGIADPERMCIVGWSYGGYAALMSTVEYPDRYRCVVSIAGVTDPRKLIDDEDSRYYKKVWKEFIGRDSEVVERGSPRRRAAEIQVPALLFHGKKDLNVPFDHSKVMKKALRKAKKEVELVEYEGVAHSIDREKYRIDMLTRIGVFLDENLAPRATASVGASD